jgi:M6 family metalloprotease-like protein
MEQTTQHYPRISKLSVWLAFFLLSLLSTVLYAAWFDELPTTVNNADGTEISCYASGDEYFNWLHDADGFTIIAGEDGNYYYAELSGETIAASAHRVGQVNPVSIGLTPWLKIPKHEYLLKREAFWEGTDRSVRAPHIGTLNNLVVYIRFSDQPEFTVPRYVYDSRFNNPDGVSMKHYFYEVSYEQLLIESHHYPITDLLSNLSYVDQYPRSYYLPYHAVNNPNGYQNDNQRRLREHTLLMNAVNYIEEEVPVDMVIDGDGDGLVDNVCFIIRGSSGNWADLLWAHRWVLYSFDVYIHGKQVFDYTFQPENQNNTKTLCHEMFHVLGAPDLYHYTSTGFTPVGPWDLMQSGFGHMGAFMKYKYANQNWIAELPEITVGGTYTLNPITSPENNAFKIASPNHASQYFVVEYRKRQGLYESSLPGDGLLVYRINPAAGNGNAGGPPDEVYIYRRNGTTISDGNINQAHFSLNASRTAINDDTNPGSFLQNGSPGGLNIFNISAIGETISFDILMGTEIDAGFTADATTVPAGETIQFTDQSTNLPTSWAWSFPGGVPESSTQQHPEVMYAENGIYTVSLTASNEFGEGFIEKPNFIIVGTPEFSLDEEEIIISLETNTQTSYSMNIHNNGDTWLRYTIDWAYPEETRQRAQNGQVGDLLGEYMNIPTDVTSMTWVNDQLYMCSWGGDLHIYDTTYQEIIQSFDIHSQAIGIVYDGELIWVGSSTGIVYGYHPDGSSSGQEIQMITGEAYTLAWDGTYFLTNRIVQSNPLVYRFDHDGNIIETFSLQGVTGSISQLCWVEAHKDGKLWANAGNKVIRLKRSNNSFNLVEEFDVAGQISYTLTHDGIDLWWAKPSGNLFRFDDGLAEWLHVDLTENLIEAGQMVDIPIVFNTKGLEVGTYEASILFETNDYNEPLLQLPVVLNVTLPTIMYELDDSALRIYSTQGIIYAMNPGMSALEISIFDVTGRLVFAKNQSTNNPIIIHGLDTNRLYIIRIVSSEKTLSKRLFVH